MHTVKTTSYYVASKVKTNFNKRHMADRPTLMIVRVRTLPIYEYFVVAF